MLIREDSHKIPSNASAIPTGCNTLSVILPDMNESDLGSVLLQGLKLGQISWTSCDFHGGQLPDGQVASRGTTNHFLVVIEDSKCSDCTTSSILNNVLGFARLRVEAANATIIPA